MTIICPDCGTARVRAARQVAALRSFRCRECQNKDLTPTVCPGCGLSRQYPPSVTKKLKSPFCWTCIHGDKPKSVTCPDCGAVRAFAPATIARLKTPKCRACVVKEQMAAWVTVKCLQCGRERRMSRGDARKVKTGSCLHCARHAPGVLPDTFDAGYVTGTVLGDGWLVRRRGKEGVGFTIGLTVTDPAFAARFARHLEACVGRRPWQGSSLKTTKGDPVLRFPPQTVLMHRVMLTSRDWYDRLAPYKIDRAFDGLAAFGDDFRRGFLQGLIDSEGYIPANRIYLDIANKDLALLAAAVAMFAALGQRAKVYGPYPYSRGVAHLRARAGAWVKTVAVVKSPRPRSRG